MESTARNLRGQIALITGAARGLGKTLATDLAAQGVGIAGADLRSDELVQTMAGLETQFQVPTLSLALDVSQEDQVQAAVAQTVRDLGQIDILINNAGMRHVSPVWEMDSQSWDQVHGSNLKGQFLFARETLRQSMLERNQGVLIFVSSLAGKRSLPKGSAYCSSKWGVLGLAASVAQDLKRTRIRVGTFAPGMILTPMARESEVWDKGLDWLDPKHVSRAILHVIQQEEDTIIPEMMVLHRAQL